jgi:uncharacterized membrane protein YcaP (DUF421 family)
VETVMRVTFVFLLVMVVFRVLGKRELTQMSPFELVMLLFIPQLFSRALTRQDYSLTNGVIGFATLVVLVSLTSIAGFQSRSVGRLLKGAPAVLVSDGRFVEEALQRERITPDDVFSQLHKAGLDELRMVKWAILETNGKISIVPAASRSLAPSVRREF